MYKEDGTMITYMHIEGIYAKIICSEVDTFENFSKGQMFLITKDDIVLRS